MTNDALIGKTIGQYKILERLGEGGMGRVYRAHQDILGRDVALKIMSPEMTTKPGYLERFAREAKVSAKLENPSITTIYDSGKYGNLTYIAMKLLTGGSLELRLRQRVTALPSLGEVAKMLTDLAHALDYAHRLEVIHRDIKPANIMFDAQGKPYLVDFGIAKLLDSTEMGLTGMGMTMGSPSYMPPEQWKGEGATAKSDQYALAVSVYNTLTGRLPFEADNTPALMYMHLQDDPKPITDIRPNFPMQIMVVLGKAMSKDPTRRWESCAAFAEAFTAAVPDTHKEETGFFTSVIKRVAYETFLDDPWTPLVVLPHENTRARSNPNPAPSLPLSSPAKIATPVPLAVSSMPEVGAVTARAPRNTLPLLIGGIIGVLVLVLVVLLMTSPSLSDLTPTPSLTPDDTPTVTVPIVIVATTVPTDSPTPTDAPTDSPTLAAPLTPGVGMTVRALSDTSLRKDTSRFIIMVTSLATGETAEIIEIIEQNTVQWIKVRTTDGLEGWGELHAFEVIP
jgi:serine/threonine protein kinase